MRRPVREVWPRVAGRLTRDDWVDAALAVLMAAVTTIETLSGNYDEGPVWLVVVTGLLLTLPLALRRRYPIGVYALVLVMIVVQTVVLGSNEGVGIFFGLLVSLYTLAAHRPLRPALIGLLAFVPIMAFSNWRADGNPFEDLSFIVTLTSGAWVAGRIVWSRQLMVDQLSAQAVELERGRAAEARLAAAEERARIARELHDVVAHSVSVMVVQAEAAEALLSDSERSGQALHAIQDTGRTTLAELRHLLGALDDDSAPDEIARIARQPSPRLGDADRLVEHLRAAGLDVSLRVEGQDIDIPSGVDLAAYRVLQEALTNALRHAGRTSVDASVLITNDEVMVDVIDRGPAASSSHRSTTTYPGRGLVGMRERVTLYGGHVESGPAGSGFRVRARIPVRASE
ncbi:MAG TPA: histidine kinase [Jiangellaceae bacterium]|nr:histidine kinase [Jiangellaceae bacterium]